VTPGKDGSDRDAMTAARLDRFSAPGATDFPHAPPMVVARSRPPALALRFGLAGVAVASAIVGWVLFGDTNPAIWVEGYWPVRELMPAAIAFSIGGALELLMGLSLTILPQLHPDGPLPGRLWKILLGVSGGLIVIAALANQYDSPTVYDLYEWYFWSTVVGLGWLIALASLAVRWHRGTSLLRRRSSGSPP
jgi:hypothetical protein